MNRRVLVYPLAELADPQVQDEFGHARPVTLYRYDALNRLVAVLEASNVPQAELGGHLPPASQTRYDIGGRVLLTLQPARTGGPEAPAGLTYPFAILY